MGVWEVWEVAKGHSVQGVCSRFTVRLRLRKARRKAHVGHFSLSPLCAALAFAPLLTAEREKGGDVACTDSARSAPKGPAALIALSTFCDTNTYEYGFTQQERWDAQETAPSKIRGLRRKYVFAAGRTLQKCSYCCYRQELPARKRGG